MPTYDAMIFHAPNRDGYVTVNYKDRVFRTGVVYHGPVDSDGREYKGVGWRKRLELDAQIYLAGILAR